MSRAASSPVTTKRDLKWSPRHPIYLESEVELAKSGAGFVPYKMTQLRVAIREDMKRVLYKVSEYAASDTSMDWLTDGDEPGKIHARIARALQFIHHDSEDHGDDSADSVDSYEYGRDRILDLALEKADGCEETVEDIHSCMIALIARGEIQQSFDLARLAGALKCVSPHNVIFERAEPPSKRRKATSPRSGPDGLELEKPVSREQNQYLILTTLQGLLDKGEVPTKRALCSKTFGVSGDPRTKVGDPKMQKYQFSKVSAGMKIAKAVPDEPRDGSAKLVGTTYQFDLHRDPIAFPPMGVFEFPIQNAKAPIVWDEPLSPHAEPSRLETTCAHLVKRRDGIYRLVNLNCRLLDRGDGRYQIIANSPRFKVDRRKSSNKRRVFFDRNLTRIKEALGVVYHALLLKFQMPEPTTPDELDRFVEKLSLTGIELGWARKRKMAWNPPRMKPFPPGSV